MLLNNEKHKRYHSLGPADCYFGRKGKAVASISVTRSTVDNEQMTINIPVFSDDTRQTLDDRIGMFLSLPQERMEDANAAWQLVQDEHKAEQDRLKAEAEEKKKR